MFGFTSSGCFIMGIVTGFIIALVIAVACVFYFKPDVKVQVISHVEQLWTKFKNNVDTSIEAAKNAPSAETSTEQAAEKNSFTVNAPASTSRNGSYSPASQGGGAASKPKELKLSW